MTGFDLNVLLRRRVPCVPPNTDLGELTALLQTSLHKVDGAQRQYDSSVERPSALTASPDAETGVAELSVAELSVAELGVAELGVAETGVAETGVAELGVAELGIAELGIAELGVAETGVAETGVAETGVVPAIAPNPSTTPTHDPAPVPLRGANPNPLRSETFPATPAPAPGLATTAPDMIPNPPSAVDPASVPCTAAGPTVPPLTEVLTQAIPVAEPVFCNCVLIVEPSPLGETLVGIVTPADLAWGALQQLDLRGACARDVMTPNPITTHLEDLAQGGMQALESLREYHIRYLPIVDDHHRPLGVVTLDDIVQMMNVRLSETRISLEQEMRERKLAEQQMQTYALRMRYLLDALPDLVLVLDELGDRIEVVPTQLSQTEGEGGLITNCTIEWLSDPGQAGMALDQVRHAICTQTQQSFEYSLRVGLQVQWFLASISPMSDQSAMWVARNISDRKCQEAALKATNDTESDYRITL